jgi:serpin B
MTLRALGMKSAFDDPRGSANLDRMASPQANDHLHLSEVFHKTLIAVDEIGTEAAAATVAAVRLGGVGVVKHSPPIEVRVDRPFVFAIQHVPSGTCLFLGRVTDPR